MIKKLVTRLDMKGLDAVMLVAGLIGGLAGSFLAVRTSEHRNHPAESAVITAAEHHEAESKVSATVDAGAPEPHKVADHHAVAAPAEHRAEE